MTVTGRVVQRTDGCPHGLTYAECTDSWCKARIEDIESGRYRAPLIGAPETVEEFKGAEAIKPKADSNYLAALADTTVAIKTTVEWHPECGTPPWPLGTQWPAKTAYCHHCMRWWSGERPGHCAICHCTLGSDTAFDQHRHGKYPNRRCRSTDWMREHGWSQDGKGIWRLPKPDKNPFDKKRGPRRGEED